MVSKEQALAKSRRVFELAKELGVSSKAVIAKCKAEGVPDIINHMSKVKLGLEQTIREWFSEEHKVDTAVEAAEQVDLNRVKKPARRRARPAGSAAASGGGDAEDSQVAVAEPEKGEEEPQAAAGEPEDGGDDGAAVAEAEAEAPAGPARPTARPRRKEDAGAPAAPDASAAPPSAAPEAEAESPAQDVAQKRKQPAGQDTDQPASAPAQAASGGEKIETDETAEPVKATRRAPMGPVGVPNVPTRPENVGPAGERLERPVSAKLKGPKVVRIEKPDSIAAPRSRRPGGGPGRGPGAPGGPERESGGEAQVARSRGPVRGRGAGAGTGREAEGESRRGAGKRRALSSRRGGGRYGEALPTGPTKLTAADVAELDARLNQSAGYVQRKQKALRRRDGGGTAAQPALVTGGKVEIEEPIFIKDLSAATGIKAADIIKYLFKQGIMTNINSAIDADTAMEVCLEYNIELEVKAQKSAAEQIEAEFEARAQVDVRPRPPIVTVLGHVDHGKTSLLDRIRAADVAAHEAGGITQHVGAYRVTVHGADGQEKTVVFLDTPGHEAFTSMRARGAGLTDLVVLVCAADDGVMPQTVESINHARAAGVPIVVALNKIDRPEVDDTQIQKIYGQLAAQGLNPVPWGGDTEVVSTSATTGQGVEELLELLDYQAELLELKADYGGPARGTVIESEMQEGRGPVARVMVEQGQLKVGGFIVVGRAFGRVRDMTDDRGRSIREAGPATPVELSGIDMVPDAGNKFFVTDTLKRAEEVAHHYREIEREQQLASKTKVTLANFAEQLAAGETRELRVVLKADVHGSLDVLRKSLEEMGNDEVSVRVLHAAVGGVTESDVLLADASDAVIIGFHVVIPPAVREIAEQHKVDVRLYRIIYDLTNDVKSALEGLLKPEVKEEVLGRAEVRQVFRVSKIGQVAGCLVTEGVIQRNTKVRVERDGTVVTDNRELASLRRVKDDVREVRMGTECGIRVAGFDDVKPGDVITCYKVIEVKRTLD